MKTKFVTDQKRKKIAVVIPMRGYEDLLLDNYSAAVTRKSTHGRISKSN
jgi:hypothetical protein